MSKIDITHIDLGFREKHYREVDYQHTEASKKLWEGLMSDSKFKEQTLAILKGKDQFDLSPSFLGFVGIYYNLSKIIPLDRVIYDMGCSCAFQSWFFRYHKKYIGVDLLCPIDQRLKMDTSHHVKSTIDDYSRTIVPESPHFAICNYVPPWHGDNEQITKDIFKHVFIFYPETEK